MKKILCILLVLCTMQMLGVTVLASDSSFNDIDNGHWAYEDINAGVEKGFFAGYPDGSFKPEQNVTRAEAIKILTDFLGRTTAKPAKSKYSDIDVNAWYAPYANVSEFLFPERWVDEKLFKADTPITREEVVYAIVTAMRYDYKLDRADLSLLKSYSDREEIGLGFDAYMALAIEFGVISGYSDNTIRPDANITRAEFATIMSRVSKQKAVIDERRQQVVDYMEKDISVLWRSDRDFVYALSTSDLPPEERTGSKIVKIYKDRIYRGVIYSYAAGDIGTFLDYSAGQDENGIHTISGLTWQDVSTAGGSATRVARIGNDCGASIQLAYGSIGHNRSICGITKMSPVHGYYHVGKFDAPVEYNVDTPLANTANGKEVMYQAFSQLQKGDAIVRVKQPGWGSHGIMVAGVNVVYNEKGKIDPVNSTLLLYHQSSSGVLSEDKHYDEKLGCDVYEIGLIHTRSFEWAYDSYIPVTPEILIDPTPIEKPVVTDSLSEHTTDYTLYNLFTGTISSNWMIADAEIVIKDASGNVVQSSKVLPTRSAEVYIPSYGSSFKIDMSKFKTTEPGLISGEIDIDKLEKGNYNCRLTVRLVSGEKFTVREFDFTKAEKVAIAKIGEKSYNDIAEALAEAKDGDTIELMAGTFELGEVRLPDEIVNVTIKGAADKATVIKNSIILSADSENMNYTGVTFDGIVFENSYFKLTDLDGAALYKDWTITNCEFLNLVTPGVNTPVFSYSSKVITGKMNGFTFTNNVVDGVSGKSNTGIKVGSAAGKVLISNNIIKNVAWNAMQIWNMEESTEDAEEPTVLEISNNTISEIGAKEGMLNLDKVTCTIILAGNTITRKITNQPYMCYVKNTLEVSGNTWIDENGNKLDDEAAQLGEYEVIQ